MNKENRSKMEIRMLCNIFGFLPENLKTKIDIYSRNSSGKKVIIDKRLYSADDLIEERANSRLYDFIMASIIKECNIEHGDIIDLTYPDHQTLEPRTLVIEITHFIEKTENIKLVKEGK